MNYFACSVCSGILACVFLIFGGFCIFFVGVVCINTTNTTKYCYMISGDTITSMVLGGLITIIIGGCVLIKILSHVNIR
jgi:hypothetical protein